MTADSRDTLIMALLAVHDAGAAQFDDRGYADWSCRNQDGTYRFEFGETRLDGQVVTLDLTRTDLLALHAALTKTLLAGDDAP